ncbi:MAG TPA: phospholipid carrier-dependent glycosyltransferase [Bryobacterales bacterium]|nr:phospholipid carrier-dependent glycosyltransferase [Bryobacterales bacterium]
MPGKASRIAVLAAILALYAVWSASSWSAADFGYLHDDSLYLSSARALAEGRGYIIPSVPTDPPQNKYPIGYPFLLSLLWRIEPDLPGLLRLIFGTHILLGCGFLLAAYSLLRQLGQGPRSSLALTAVCALHPGIGDVTRFALSDLPFMFLALGSAVAAEKALREDAPNRWLTRWWAAAAVLACGAILTRSIAVAIVAGIFFAAVVRRAPKPAALYAAICAAVFFASSDAPPGSGSPAQGYSGYEQTLLFYTDYIGFWRFSVPDWATLAKQLEFNGMQILKAPAYLCFFLPVLGFASGGLQATGIVLTVGIVRGLFRGVSRTTFHPVMGALFCYLPVVLLWNYSLADRFLLLFVPLLYHGAAVEIGSVLAPMRELLKPGGETGQRIAAGILSTLIVILLGYAAYRCLWEIPAGTREANAERAALLQQKQQAYDWLRKNSEAGDRLIAYEDVVAYLSTGRQGMRPIAPSTASFYLQDREALQPDLDRLGDTARAIEARYWLASPDDYQLEHADTYLKEATAELLDDAPVAFKSHDGRVLVYEIRAALLAR